MRLKLRVAHRLHVSFITNLIGSSLSFANILADQQLLRLFGDLLLRLSDVLLCRLDIGVAKEVLHQHDVLAVVVKIGGLRDSEVVALEV